MTFPARYARILILLLLMAAWEVAGRRTSRVLLTPLSEVGRTLFHILTLNALPNFYLHVGITLQAILTSFVLTTLAGLVLGFLLGMWRRAGDAFSPIITALWAVPPVIFYPVMLGLLGLGVPSKVGLAFAASFPLVVLGTISAVRGIDALLIRVAKAYGAKPQHIFVKVIVPAAASTLAGTLRLAFSVCVIMVLVGELLAGGAGLGHVLDSASKFFRTSQYLAVVLFTLAFAFVLNLLATFAERRVRAWTRQ